jgi:hypothetical protein
MSSHGIFYTREQRLRLIRVDSYSYLAGYVLTEDDGLGEEALSLLRSIMA